MRFKGFQLPAMRRKSWPWLIVFAAGINLALVNSLRLMVRYEDVSGVQSEAERAGKNEQVLGHGRFLSVGQPVFYFQGDGLKTGYNPACYN
jgi:hypothetical protein